MSGKMKIGALVSGGGTNLQAIIDACQSGRIDARVVFVGADREHTGGLERARNHAIPRFVVDYNAIIKKYRDDPVGAFAPPADFNIKDMLNKQRLFHPKKITRKVEAFLISRAIAEARLLEHIKLHSVDLLVLCGYMRNLTPYFIDRFTPDINRPNIMNIHPALLPAFPGMDGYGDTVRYGCKVGGCTVHFIDYGEDTGPIIGQRAFTISDDDDLDVVRKKGLALEWQLYPECIQLFAQGRLQVVTMTHCLNHNRTIQKKVVKIAQVVSPGTISDAL